MITGGGEAYTGGYADSSTPAVNTIEWDALSSELAQRLDSQTSGDYRTLAPASRSSPDSADRQDT
jgi:hypothetical protein